MKCLSVDPPIESFVDGRLKSCLDSIADEMDTSESAHLFALEPACEEETEEGGERGEEEEEDEDVLDEKEKEAIPRLLDLSLSVSGVRQAAAPPDSSQGTKDEGQTSLHNSKGVHLSTVVKKGLSLFMPNSSTNTSTQGCFRFRVHEAYGEAEEKAAPLKGHNGGDSLPKTDTCLYLLPLCRNEDEDIENADTTAGTKEPTISSRTAKRIWQAADQIPVGLSCCLANGCT
uniref:Uncharacterized protein n=1 Tax=Chromera velia CCMP2878 TaxID=1169474 RepID=A0A0K6S6Z6_9ALVE|eukprot:Cvel_20143.t1-p1 / transcript=Cvel_20143.t1 / gene=Cvel_20143 / organism=Chromera_velia_CCMP2878 / gene_product=hypothetical protein / transcript_product=hypothetical protein / location=Cvel_scaffold1787:29401-37896(-) / protein_length=229 / sequence_SO=supercontig / SO=protein_coding / is_pseudo=false